MKGYGAEDHIKPMDLVLVNENNPLQTTEGKKRLQVLTEKLSLIEEVTSEEIQDVTVTSVGKGN